VLAWPRHRDASPAARAFIDFVLSAPTRTEGRRPVSTPQADGGLSSTAMSLPRETSTT
jgi:hypothetical protein